MRTLFNDSRSQVSIRFVGDKMTFSVWANGWGVLFDLPSTGN